MDCSRIGEFYRSRSVLVTGGTGFMGKVLIEKLLRSCAEIHQIFVLVRTKPGGKIEDRIQEIVDTPIFRLLKQSSPHQFKKLMPVNGDVSLPGLGLSPFDLQVLQSHVSVVFHVAARIRFDRNIKEAVDINVKGTRYALQVAHQLSKLEALVYVSTAYVHPETKDLHEEIYTAPMEPDQVINAVDTMTSDQLEQLMKRLLGKCPNVYSFTKAVAEHLLRDERGHLPLVIVRPSIVTPAWKEPLPGWTDNINGPSGGAVGALTGFIRVLKANPDAVGDPIPVDYPINMIIAAAWHKATNKCENISVYNCGTSYLNPITWRQFHVHGMRIAKDYPSEKLLWYPSITVTSNPLIYETGVLFFHYLPGYILDVVAKLKGNRLRLVRLYDKVYRTSKCTEFYTCGEWIFHTENMMTLTEAMSEVDRQVFQCDVRLIDWPNYLHAYALGIRQFILKEDSSTLSLARRRIVRFYWVRLLFRATVFVTLLSIAYFVIRRYWDTFSFRITSDY